MDDLTLTPPAPALAVAPTASAGLVPIDDGTRTELDRKVDAYVTELVAQPSNSPEFGRKVDQLSSLGQAEIARLAGQSNRFLDRPVKAMDGEGSVGSDLIRLRRVVEDLDPGRGGDLLSPRRILGIIPFGKRINGYFDKYRSAQSHISGILAALASGRDTLVKDNIAIDTERRNLWDAMGKLEQMIHLSKTLDARLEDKALELDSVDPAKAKALRESALFYVRQRSTDLLTQMAVSVQGYLALDLVKKNNIELVKGVDRASTTTVAALRTAVTVAQALTSQRLVLEQITALNTTTASVIDATGKMLKDNTARIHEQATQPTIQVEVLKRAFQNIYETMDAIDTFKVQALSSMKQTVDSLSGELEKSKGYIARAQGADAERLPAPTF
jgi:uncharacterized protein YaaN involved in tellurite resistance